MTQSIELSVPLMGPGQDPENLGIVSEELDIPHPEHVFLLRESIAWQGDLSREKIPLEGPVVFEDLEEILEAGLPIYFDFLGSKKGSKILQFYGIIENEQEYRNFPGEGANLYYVDMEKLPEEHKKYFDFWPEKGLQLTDILGEKQENYFHHRTITYMPENKVMEYQDFSRVCKKISCSGEKHFRTIPKGIRVFPESRRQEKFYSLYYNKTWVAKEVSSSDAEMMLSN